MNYFGSKRSEIFKPSSDVVFNSEGFAEVNDPNLLSFC